MLSAGRNRPKTPRPALSRAHNLAESVLLRWRKEYEARGEEAFTEKQPASREEALEARIVELERFCGKLSLENEILKKGLSKYHSSTDTP